MPRAARRLCATRPAESSGASGQGAATRGAAAQDPAPVEPALLLPGRVRVPALRAQRLPVRVVATHMPRAHPTARQPHRHQLAVLARLGAVLRGPRRRASVRRNDFEARPLPAGGPPAGVPAAAGLGPSGVSANPCCSVAGSLKCAEASTSAFLARPRRRDCGLRRRDCGPRRWGRGPRLRHASAGTHMRHTRCGGVPDQQAQPHHQGQHAKSKP